MKILHVIPSLDQKSGGPCTVVREMVHHLHDAGVSVSIVSTLPRLRSTRTIPEHSDLGEIIFGAYFGSYSGVSLDLLSWLRKNVGGFDLVHLHSVMNVVSFLTMRLCRKNRVPFIVTPHGILDEYSFRQKHLKKWLFFNGFERRLLKRALAIHCATEYERNQLVRFFPPSKLTAIPFGTNMLEVAGEAREKKTNDEKKGKTTKTILYLGRANKKKGLEMLLEAASRLAKKRQDFKLFLCGDFESRYGRQLRQLSRKMAVEPLCSFPGFLNLQEKRSMFESADIFALPSQDENFGVAALEAMACGVPVVVSKQVGLSDEVRDSQAGLVIDPSVDQLCFSLEYFLEHEAMCMEMGKRGREMVKGKYGWSKIIPRYIELYEKCLR